MAIEEPAASSRKRLSSFQLPGGMELRPARRSSGLLDIWTRRGVQSKIGIDPKESACKVHNFARTLCLASCNLLWEPMLCIPMSGLGVVEAFDTVHRSIRACANDERVIRNGPDSAFRAALAGRLAGWQRVVATQTSV